VNYRSIHTAACLATLMPVAVGGLMAVVEAVRQLRGEAGERQVERAAAAIVHGEGGVLSSHCTAILTAEAR